MKSSPATSPDAAFPVPLILKTNDCYFRREEAISTPSVYQEGRHQKARGDWELFLNWERFIKTAAESFPALPAMLWHPNEFTTFQGRIWPNSLPAKAMEKTELPFLFLRLSHNTGS